MNDSKGAKGLAFIAIDIQLNPKMIIDCEAALVIPRCSDRIRYSRAKVGLASDSAGTPVLIVITSQSKEKFKIINNCSVRTTTLGFDSPKRDLYLRNCDQLLVKTFMALVTKIIRKQSIPKLANISSVEKLKPKQTSLTIKDNNYCSSDLSNKCLQKLFCENLRLIPRLVWKLNNLSELKLISCELTDIPIRLHDLAPTLRVLDLSRNQIHAIDGSFFNAMNRLMSLDLSHNRLEYIGFEIKRMASLERLNVGSNGLSHLPNTLGTICSLKYLDISHNQFNCLPFSFIKQLLLNVRLINFDISGNPFKEKTFKSTPAKVRRFPTLQCLSSATILSTDCLLYSCHKILPKFMYKSIETNGENCCICGRFLVNRGLKLAVIPQSLEQTTVCLSTSHFPTFPLIPSVQYICFSCIL